MLLGVQGWWRRRSRGARRRLIVYPLLGAAVGGFLGFTMIMPGRSFHGTLAPLDDDERRIAFELERDVSALAKTIGERNLSRKGTLDRSWQLLEGELGEAGYRLRAQTYEVDGHRVANVEATRAGQGRGAEIVVVGAHYDSVPSTPGADDNASGVATMLALARIFAHRETRRTVRFVAFVNEEPPFFWNETMGSLHYAKECRDRGDGIVAMLSLESLGYYRDEPGSQKYPPVISWFYPDRGDFVAFVGDLGSRSLVHEAIGTFRAAARFPSEGAALPGFVAGVGWSDQWSFWQMGYPGVMVTDTATFRNPHYHQPTDTPGTLDYPRLARVTAGLATVLAKIASP